MREYLDKTASPFLKKVTYEEDKIGIFLSSIDGVMMVTQVVVSGKYKINGINVPPVSLNDLYSFSLGDDLYEVSRVSG